MQNNIVWFRNDLRIYDNPALSAAVSNPSATIRAVFLISERQWISHGWGANKIGFVLRCVIALEKELAKLSIPLDIIDSSDFKKGVDLLAKYLVAAKCSELFFNLEYELNEINRDAAIASLLKLLNIKTNTFNDQVIIHPETIRNLHGNPYTVFTPFKKSYLSKISSNHLKIYSKPKKRNQILSQIYIFPRIHQHYLNSNIQNLWPAGENAGLKILKHYCSEKIFSYADKRDMPSLDATSKISPYLAVGALSAKQCLVAAMRENRHSFTEGNLGILTWINEIIWHDFYKYILYHYPKICRLENFNAKYNHIPWKKNPTNLLKWQQGKTGIPIIDAAMRQLVTTGWMHNRLRMVVAMFLTKNLLIDWRSGEDFFARHLIDLDFASNNGGWQWSASTGTDAAPYFRIFNPITQSEKFDPEGKFIKQYCPELTNLDNKTIHNPSAYFTNQELAKINYPFIMVDINKSRKLAIEIYKNL